MTKMYSETVQQLDTVYVMNLKSCVFFGFSFDETTGILEDGEIPTPSPEQKKRYLETVVKYIFSIRDTVECITVNSLSNLEYITY